MATILANGLIQFSDGQILYSDTPISGQHFMELQELLPQINPVIGRSAMVGFPFISGGGGGGGGGGGTPGARGADGAPGAPGATGPQGVTGPSGGPQGATGVQGVQGQTGPGAGQQGATGIQGVTGVAGGGTGPQGTTGVAGSQGQTGVQGATGPGSSVRSDATGTTTASPVTLFTDTSPKFLMGIGTVKNTGANGLTVQETVTDAFGTTVTASTNVPAGNTYMLDPQTNISTGLPPYVSYSVAVLDQVGGSHTTFEVHFGALLGT